MRKFAVLLFVGFSAFAQDYSGSWCGSTSQGKAIYFRVVGNQVTYARISFLTNGIGSSCPVGASKTLSPPASISGGAASFGENGPAGVVPVLWTVNASFSSTTSASGTFSVLVQPGPFITCGGVNPGASGTWTATRSAPLSIAPQSKSFGSGGGSGRINVTAATPCDWKGSETTSWITLQGNSGTGEGTVRYLVSANTSGASRSAAIGVNDLSAIVTQSTTPETRHLAVIGSTPGSLGSFFKTSVQIHNRTTAAMSGRFVFHTQGQPGTSGDPTLDYSLAAGQTLQYADLLPAMNQGGLGSVDVVSTAGGFPVMVARIFNDAGAAGTTGMTEDLIADEDALGQGDQAVLIAPPDAATARFNVGVRTLGAGATIRMTQRSADGTVVRTATKTYGANFFEQTSSAVFTGGSVGSGDSITLAVDAGNAVVYGSATDNKTQDPALQVARRISTSTTPGETRYLAVVGSSPGSLGSFFRTAVQIHNPTASTIAGKFVFHTQGVSGSAGDPAMNYSLAPGQTTAYSDLLPAMGLSGLGSIDVVSTAGALPVAVARVYNDAGDAGTTGLSEELVSADQVLHRGENSILIAPSDLSAARFNIGIRTLVAGASMNINVLDSSGKSVKTLQKTFSPTFFQQIAASQFIEGDVPAGGAIFIFISNGSAVLYGATTDNKTQDPSVQFTSRAL